jgi:acyl-CoA dehydrogenase
MDFTLTEEQEAVRDLAARIFEGHASVERVKAVEATEERFDRELWAELARANLLGIALPDDVGGSGFGIVELCLLLEQQGRRVAPIPLLPTLMGAAAVAELGSAVQRGAWLPAVVSGEVVLSFALEGPPGAVTATATNGGGEGSWRLDGVRVGVPAAAVADRLVVAAGERLFLVDPRGPGVTIELADTTNRERRGHVRFDGAPAEALGVDGGVEWLRQRVVVGLCALAVGVAEEAVRMAASYTSGRQQFGKPLSTFQGVALRAADAYIDTEAMRVTLWQAAWRLAEGLDASKEVPVAKWWASDAGERVLHATQHLHGGIGADVDYPIHRYFLWGKEVAATLGGASQQLSRLGRAIAEASA